MEAATLAAADALADAGTVLAETDAGPVAATDTHADYVTETDALAVRFAICVLAGTDGNTQAETGHAAAKTAALAVHSSCNTANPLPAPCVTAPAAGGV